MKVGPVMYLKILEALEMQSADIVNPKVCQLELLFHSSEIYEGAL